MKQLLKRILRLLFFLIVVPLILLDFVARMVFKDGFFLFVSQFLSLIPGIGGSYCRVAYFSYAMKRCEKTAYIGFSALFSQKETEIYHGVYIGPQCNIGLCKIEESVLIGSGVHIMSGSNQHGFSDLDTPIQQQEGHYEKITIGEDSWIGNGSIVMADIGKKCIIGSGSVVTKPIPDYSIVVGNPARIIRSRQ